MLSPYVGLVVPKDKQMQRRLSSHSQSTLKKPFKLYPPMLIEAQNRSQSEIGQIDQRKVDSIFYRSKIQNKFMFCQKSLHDVEQQIRSNCKRLIIFD